MRRMLLGLVVLVAVLFAAPGVASAQYTPPPEGITEEQPPPGDGAVGVGVTDDGAAAGTGLPRTGTDALPLSRLALALVVLGAGMVLLTDRRRTHQPVRA